MRVVSVCGLSVCLALALNHAWGEEPAPRQGLSANTPEAANLPALQAAGAVQPPEPVPAPGKAEPPDRSEKGELVAMPKEEEVTPLPPLEPFRFWRMLGDQGPLGTFPPFAPPAGAIKGAVLVPSVRGFKISDDESPKPQDRVYVDFNYYDDLNDAVNRRLGVDLHNVRVYRETFGLEKTFLDGDASIGLRLPLNTLSADSGIPVLGGSSTDVGDLTVIFKGTLWENRNTGDLFSAGLAVTAPTGPDSFAGANFITSFHNTTLQPFLGYIWNSGDVYLHGFTAIDIPTDSNDVTILYNDVGIGYYLYRNGGCGRMLTAVVPTFEVHVNTPLNHRGAFRLNDPAGTPDVVDLTTGTIFELNRRSTLAVGIVTPVTGPKPFNVEALVQFNLNFGRMGRRAERSIASPTLGE
jgi:hypothetical protein